MSDSIPTYTITPNDPPQTEGPEKLSGPPTNTAKPLTFTDMVQKWKTRGYSDAGAAGIADNMMRESQGDPKAEGDDKTSLGLFQHHAERKAALEAYAKEHKADPTDPDVQIDFADQELKTKFPKLRETLMSTDDRAHAEDQFKRVFERPASVMWDSGATVGTDRYRYSDYAMGEHNKRRNTDLVYMAPQDYLDLSPDLEAEPFASPSGRALKKSVGAGDEIESVPSLDVKVSGPTGTVTAQDGRHRALLAQEEGIDAIPVAINRKGQGQPTELVGMGDRVLPHDFTPAKDVTHEKQGGSILGRIAGAIIPRAEAAEPGFDPFAPAQPAAGTFDPFAPAQAQPPTAGERFAMGVADPVVGAGQLAAHLAPPGTMAAGMAQFNADRAAAGLPPMDPGTETQADLVARADQEARQREAAYQARRGPDAGTDWWRLGGNAAATVPLSALGGVAAPAGAGFLGAGAAGAGGGLLQPATGDGNFWTEKAEQGAAGAVGGAILGGAGNTLARMVKPTLSAAVRRLMAEGVELTPGMMKGGAARATEDKLASLPIMGDAIKAAQRRSVETFNRAAINRSLDDIGSKLPPRLDSGHEAIANAQGQFSGAYSQVIPRMSGQMDPQLQTDLVGVVQQARAQNLPQEFQDQLQHIIGNEVVARFAAGGGRISGEDAQKIGTQLDDLTKAMRISPNPYAHHLGRLVRDVDTALDAMMARQNPALQAAKDRIDAGYSKFKIVQQAAQGAGSPPETPEGTFTPARLSQAVRNRDRSKDKAAFASGDAQMQDLSNAAKAVLPAKVPNSGTWDRGALASLLTGSGAGFGTTHDPEWLIPLAGLMAGAAPYTARINRLTNAVVSRLAQSTSPPQNALATALRRGPAVLAPALGGAAAAMMAPPVAQ